MSLRSITGKSLLALMLPLAVVGVAVAGGADCPHAKAAAVHAHGTEVGEHCLFAKNVKKEAKMTDDGAVVTITGKTDAAVEHIKAHFAAHEKGEQCEGCPFSMENVKSVVKMTDKGAEVTMTGSTPDAVKAVQDWAGKKAGPCCDKMKTKEAA